MPEHLGPVLRVVLKAPRVLYRHRLGWLLGRRFLLLNHVGRHSGRRYQTVLEVIRLEPSTGETVVMSGFGDRSDWYQNVIAAGRAEVTIGRQTSSVAAAVVGEEEAAAVVAEYERRNPFLRPVVRRVLSQLAGFSYDGTADSRLSLVRKLPLVKFTPSTSIP